MALLVTIVRDASPQFLLRVSETHASFEELQASVTVKANGGPRLYAIPSLESWAADVVPTGDSYSLVQLAALRWLEWEERLWLVTDNVAVGEPVWDEENRGWLVGVLAGDV